jgi:hypothetical protein
MSIKNEHSSIKKIATGYSLAEIIAEKLYQKPAGIVDEVTTVGLCGELVQILNLKFELINH